MSIEVDRRKPHPAIFAEALRAPRRRPPADALMIGDSLGDDVAGAQAAGIDSGVGELGRVRAAGGAAEPTYVLPTLACLRGGAGRSERNRGDAGRGARRARRPARAIVGGHAATLVLVPHDDRIDREPCSTPPRTPSGWPS